MSVSDKDWELLNAYADEELSVEIVETVKARIAREPELRDALSEIQEVKRHIKSGLAQTGPEKAKNNTSYSWRKIRAAAAIFALITAGLYSWIQYDQFTRANPENIHQAYSDKGYILEKTPNIVQVSSQYTGDFKIPDLSASELKLAEAKLYYVDGKEVITAHYRGMRGCRLTFVSVGSDKDLESSPHVTFKQSAEFLKGRWQSAHSDMTLIARGMDENRFASIARFMKYQIESQDKKKQEELRIAMETTYRKAHPCA